MSRRSPDDVSEVLAEAHRRTSAAGGCTPLVGDRVRVAQAKLSAARRRYFQSEVVLCELDAILDNVGDVSVLPEGTRREGTESQAASSVRAAYITALAETHTLPTAAPPKHSAVFGLEPNRVPHGDPTSHTPRGGDQALVAALEARLQRRCDELLRFYDPSMSESAHGAHQVAAKAAQLATMVAAEREAAIAAAHRSAAAAVEVVAGPMATRNSRATASALDTLELIISRHKLDARRHYIETTTKFLKAKSTAIRLKLRALLLQVLRDTYTTGNLTALAHIRRYMSQNAAKTRKVNSEFRETLARYQVLGPAFKTITTEYADTLQAIDTKRWELHELLQRQTRSVGRDPDATSDHNWPQNGQDDVEVEDVF